MPKHHYIHPRVQELRDQRTDISQYNLFYISYDRDPTKLIVFDATRDATKWYRPYVYVYVYDVTTRKHSNLEAVLPKTILDLLSFSEDIGPDNRKRLIMDIMPSRPVTLYFKKRHMSCHTIIDSEHSKLLSVHFTMGLRPYLTIYGEVNGRLVQETCYSTGVQLPWQ